jgi:small subunit ribosomal protein S17e
LGNVRTEQIKRTAKDLLTRFPGKFSTDFENNKRMVNSLVRGGTPKVLNQIAGYITRFCVAEQKQIQEQSTGEPQLTEDGQEA